MDKKVLLLNLSDSPNKALLDELNPFLLNNNVQTLEADYSQLSQGMFASNFISKVIIYFDLSDTSEEDLVKRLAVFADKYAPFMHLVYAIDNDIEQVKDTLNECFQFITFFRLESLKSHLAAVFEDEMLVEMEEDDLMPFWQKILAYEYDMKPEEIEKISSEMGSIFMRAFFSQKLQGCLFKLFKSIYVSNKKFFPVLDYLNQFEDFKDQLPGDFYLNYKLFNKIKQGRVSYIEEEAEKKKRNSNEPSSAITERLREPLFSTTRIWKACGQLGCS